MPRNFLPARNLGAFLVFLAVVGSAFGLPALPNINTNNILNVTNSPYNCVADGATDNTTAIQTAINDAAAGGPVGGLSGGTVLISAPGGVFMTGPLTLKSKVNVQIDAGTTLRMLPLTTWTNKVLYPPQNAGEEFGSLFYANALSDVQISGSGGIDGQGLPWWQAPSTGYVFTNRPYSVWFNGSCHRVLVEDITISNTPAQNIVFKGTGGDITIQGITQSEPPSTGVANPSHNTDGLDLVGTNIFVQNCNISVGDDNFALGSSGGQTYGVLITNCVMGTGHGLSIGSSLTQTVVSNVTVVNCTYNGTDNGVRFKASRTSGGTIHHFNFYNLTMNNVQIPITIYSYYSSSVSSVPVTTAANDPVQAVTTKTPIWRDLVFSNITATTSGSFPASVLWGLPELCVSNVILQNVQITAARTFDLYNVRGFKFIDSRVTTPGTVKNFTLYNAEAVFTNSIPGTATEVTFDGLVTNSVGNTLAFYNTPASLVKSNILVLTPVTLAGSVLSVSNNLDTSLAPPVSFIVGTNAATVRVINNLALSGTINVSAGDGFTNGAYTLFSYGSGLNWGAPTLGTTPGGSYLYSLDTNSPGLVRLLVDVPLTPFQQWQVTYFGSTNNPSADPSFDADSDGLNNFAEFQAGTNPTNNASALLITSTVAQGDDLVVTWTTAGPRTNVLQSALAITTGGFTDVSSPIEITVTGDSVTNYTVIGGATNPAGFYRVRLGP